MTEVAVFKGMPIEGDVDAFLKEKGLSEQRIENMRHQAYSNFCCTMMEDLNCASPVIDYGIPEVTAFMLYLPHLNEKGETVYKRTRIEHCPFCGTHLTKRIHPDSQRFLGEF